MRLAVVIQYCKYSTAHIPYCALQMHHITLPPRPGGAQAPIRGRPAAFCIHGDAPSEHGLMGEEQRRHPFFPGARH